MATTEKRFSKEKWLEAANAQMARGHLSQREIDDACEIWVNDLDVKTQSEIEASGNQPLNEAWFV